MLNFSHHDTCRSTKCETGGAENNEMRSGWLRP